MKLFKYATILMIVALMPNLSIAKQRTIIEAQEISASFVNQRQIGKKRYSKNIIPIYKCSSSNILKRYKYSFLSESFYVFEFKNDNGYILVSADDRMPDVLSFSEYGSFNIDSIPETMRSYLNSYTDALVAINRGSDPTEIFYANNSDKSVSPLLGNIAWKQSKPYNGMCPYYNGQRTITGCVATAMAQIMKYYTYPTSYCSGSISYTTSTNKIKVSTDFSTIKFDWNNMLDSYSGSYTTTQANAVAKLMSACGAAVQMDYGLDASGASSSSVGSAMTKYFMYDKDAYMLGSSSVSADTWHTVIQNELLKSHPVYYSGKDTSKDSGHAFVIDGFKYINGYPYYHVNWGWGGLYQNYFLITKLAPDESNYSEADNYCYVNLMPDDGVDSNNFILTCSSCHTNSSVFDYGDTFSVEVKNIGTSYTGKIITKYLYVYLKSTTSGEFYRIAYLRGLNFGTGEAFPQAKVSFPMPKIVPEGDYTVMILSDTSDSFYCPQYPLIRVETSANSSLGDSNNDDNIDVVDITAIASHIKGKTPTNFSKAAADVNKDGLINVTDITSTAEMILNSSGTHEYVDLGLPSGTLWATCNIGTNKPNGYGDYFAWGETTGYLDGKNYFDWSTYQYCNGSESTITKYCIDSKYGTIDYKTKLDASDDVARVLWGNDWRLPTTDEFKELIDTAYITTTRITRNSVDGVLFTSKTNGNSMFLPLSGRCKDNSFGDGSWAGYWSYSLCTYNGNVAEILNIGSSSIFIRTESRQIGLPVRPVRNIGAPRVQLNLTKAELEIGKTLTLYPTILNSSNTSLKWNSTNPQVASVTNGIITGLTEGTTTITCSLDGTDAKESCVITVAMSKYYVDLGLPSGTIWATCNIGAEKPEDYGDYFAWGETIGYNNGKTDFSWSTYKWCNGSRYTLTKYCTDSSNGYVDNITVLEYLDDAAMNNSGNSCRIPTIEEYYELWDNCTWEWTTLNGVNGCKVTSNMFGYTDKFIFFPAAGDRLGNIHDSVGKYCCYWSSSLNTYDTYGSSYAGSLVYGSTIASARGFAIVPRYEGLSIRPVRITDQ